MYIQYKPREYVQIDDEDLAFYYAIPGYNLILCDDRKKPIKIARYIGHFDDYSFCEKYKIGAMKNFFYPNDYWYNFEDYEEDYKIIREIKAGIRKNHSAEYELKKQYPQVFVFDKTIADFICSGFSLKETNIPTEILDTIPFYKFRIKTNQTEACFEYELGNLSMKTIDETIVVNVSVTDTENSYLNILFDAFIQEEVKDFYKACKDIYGFSEEPSFELAEKKRREYIGFIENIIALVLYVSSVNAEITEKPYSQTVPDYQKEYDKEIIKYVGTKTGYDLQITIKAIQYQSYDIDGENKTRKPHMRKAHFHHYWVNDNIAGKKKLILKWLVPILVNGYKGEEKERYVK